MCVNDRFINMVLILALVQGCKAYNFFCSFKDKSMCGMKQDNTDNFDWSLGKGKTPSGETGPSKAVYGQYYIYIEASDPRKNLDKARISLPPVPSTGQYVLTFQYNMNGFYIKQLNVYVYTNSGQKELVFTKDGNQGTDWKSAKKELLIKQGNKIVFEGVRGEDYSGDIALDEIQLRSSSTVTAAGEKDEQATTTIAPSTISTTMTTIESLTETTTMTTIATTTKPTTSPSVSKKPVFRCTFDSVSFCSLRIHQNGQTVWKLSGGKDTHNITPTGGYMYMDTTLDHSGKKASIIIPYMVLTLMHRYCMEFRYYLWGNPNNSIDIESRWGMYGPPSIVVKHLRQQANQWQHVRHRIFQRRNIYFAVVGRPGKGNKGIIAVDDLTLTPC